MGEEEINYNDLYGLEPETDVTATGSEGSGEPAGTAADAPEAGRAEPEQEPAKNGAPARKEEPAAPPPTAEGAGREIGQRVPANPPGQDLGRDVDDLIRRLGIMDPYTGKPVTTKAEYDAYQKRAYDERREAIKRRSGLTDAEIDEFISTTPSVQRAMADAAAARSMMERQRREDAKRRIDTEVAKITAMDPEVKSLADLTGKAYSAKLTELVRRGYDISDAYVVANYRELSRRSADASRQAAYNAQAGKGGMTATKPSGQGGDTVTVPKDVLEMYRALNPEMTNAEIRDDYNKYIRKNGE